MMNPTQQHGMEKQVWKHWPVAYSVKRTIPLSSNPTLLCSEQANVWYLMCRLIWNCIWMTATCFCLAPRTQLRLSTKRFQHWETMICLSHCGWKKSRSMPPCISGDKFTLQNLANKSWGVQTNLSYFLYITSEVWQYYEALFLSYRPRTECSISQFSNTNKLHWAFSETVKKISKITYKYAASRFSHLQCELW